MRNLLVVIVALVLATTAYFMIRPEASSPASPGPGPVGKGDPNPAGDNPAELKGERASPTESRGLRAGKTAQPGSVARTVPPVRGSFSREDAIQETFAKIEDIDLPLQQRLDLVKRYIAAAKKLLPGIPRRPDRIPRGSRGRVADPDPRRGRRRLRRAGAPERHCHDV